MKSKVIIDKYFCFVDRNYQNTIAIQDTTQGISRDLFRWDRRFPTPRGTDKNKLNVPDKVVIQAFNTLDVEGLGFGKKASPVKSRKAIATSQVENDNTDIMMKLMIQQAKLNSERFNSMQDRINQLSEENIMLMQIVSNDKSVKSSPKSSPKVEVDESSYVDFDSTMTEEDVAYFEKAFMDEVEFIPDAKVEVKDDDEEELPPRRKKKDVIEDKTDITSDDTNTTVVDSDTTVVTSNTTNSTVAASSSNEGLLSSRARNRSRNKKSLTTSYEKLKKE